MPGAGGWRLRTATNEEWIAREDHVKETKQRFSFEVRRSEARDRHSRTISESQSVLLDRHSCMERPSSGQDSVAWPV